MFLFSAAYQDVATLGKIPVACFFIPIWRVLM